MRFRLYLGLLLAGAVVLPATASAESMRTFPVPTGGFVIGLPSSWIDVTKAAPAVLQQLERVPSFRAFAQAASQNGSLKLIAADTAGKGTVYMNVGAARLPGAYSVRQVAVATAAQLKKALGPKSSVSASPVRLTAGPAYRIHLSKKGTPNETDEYVLVKDQVEYVIVYVAPHATWKKHEPLFTSSARSFRFLPSPNLSKVILSPAQVGKGYKLSTFPFGTSFIGEATLDLCAASYPSEALRVGRLQVRYTPRGPKGSGVDVSNEVVRYTSGGAQQAIGEVASVARACAKTPAVLTNGNVKEVYTVAPLKDPKLASGAVAVKLTITVSKGKKKHAQIGLAIYQVKGDTLSGVYAFVGTGSSYADAQRIAFHAAEQSAKNLGGGSTGFTA
jgi:hypothetical protein